MSGATVDTVAMRPGEEVNAEALRDWLGEKSPSLVPAGTQVHVRQYAAGFSNLTYEVVLHGEHGDRAYVLRRPPRGVTAGGGAHDVQREFTILSVLHPLGVPVPRPVANCPDAQVIGAPFYLMERVEGTILRGAPPAWLVGDPTALPARMEAVSRLFVDTMVTLHAVPVRETPLAALGRGEGYVRRQVQGWTSRWAKSRTHAVPAMDAVAAWLDANQPAEQGAVLVHNDFKLDNLVLDERLDRVKAILDWEMATIGDPLMDLGTALAYWVEPDDAPIFRSLGLGITALPGSWSRSRLVQEYAARSTRDVAEVAFYLTFGLFKVAVIAQQIYARHVQGLTADPRFAKLGAVVEALAHRAATEAGVRHAT
jgi:aminoglycoside phosphotransferase (APT) family kinase protein